MDDIRNHDAAPTREETEWMATDAVVLVFRAVALAGIALSVGVTATLMIDQANAQPVAAAVAAR
jgi:hypothetical protein